MKPNHVAQKQILYLSMRLKSSLAWNGSENERLFSPTHPPTFSQIPVKYYTAHNKDACIKMNVMEYQKPRTLQNKDDIQMKVNSKFAMTTSSKLQWMSCPHFLFFLQVSYLVTGGSNHLCCSTASKEKYNGTCHYATEIPSVGKGWQSLYFVLRPWGINLVKKTNPVFQVFIV